MDHYGTLAGADAYHAARGREDWAEADEPDRLAALVRGSDYIDQRYRGAAMGGCAGPSFPGKKAGGRAQPLEWPRTGAVDRGGDPIAADEVPVEVERAAYEAAYRELLEPGSLSPDYIPAQLVTREKVGPIEVSYSDKAGGAGDNPMRPVTTVIDEILGPVLLRRYCGPGVRVV